MLKLGRKEPFAISGSLPRPLILTALLCAYRNADLRHLYQTQLSPTYVLALFANSEPALMRRLREGQVQARMAVSASIQNAMAQRPLCLV
jgi:hypothetical protein